MSKLKESLPDNFSVLQGDELDGSMYAPTENEMLRGWTLHDLDIAVTRVEDNPSAFMGEQPKLQAFVDRMRDAIAKIDAPF